MAWLDKIKTEVSKKEREIIDNSMDCAVTAYALGKEVFECDRAVDLSVELLLEIDDLRKTAEQKYKTAELSTGEFRSIGSFLQCKRESIESLTAKLKEKLTEYEEIRQTKSEEEE